MGTNKVKAYYDEAYPPVPSKSTLYWRKNLVWQLIRFFVLNVKMLRIGHPFIRIRSLKISMLRA